MTDIINGCFELVAGLFLFINVYKLYQDKKVKGVSIIPIIVFTAWGFWNLYFYSSLGCWYSLAGGILVVLANSIWVGMAIYYRRIENRYMGNVIKRINR